MNSFKSLIITTLLAHLFSLGCTPKGPHQLISESKNSPMNPETGKNVTETFVTFDDVKAVFSKYCMECHFNTNQAVKINWLNYEKARSYVDNGLLERQVVITKRMPLPSATSKEFTEKERALIAEWINNGSFENLASVPADKIKNPSKEIPDTPKNPVEETPIEEIPTLADTKNLLIQSCTACHGASGMSSAGAPHLAGLSKKYILTQLKAFSGDYTAKGIDKREDSETMIDQISFVEEPTGLEKDEEVKNFSKLNKLEFLAEYFSRFNFTPTDLELEPLTSSEEAIYSAGKAISEKGACLSCHTTVLAPPISGQDASYIELSLNAFKEKTRKSIVMSSVINNLNLGTEDFTALSLYLSRQITSQRYELSLLDKKNVAHYFKNQCASCHNSSPEFSRVPLLSGLQSGYLSKQMKNFSEEKRHDLTFNFMPMMTQVFSTNQIKILSDYISQVDRCNELPENKEQPSAEILSAGALLTKKCLSCHKVNDSGSTPQIHGQKADYIFNSVKAFQNDDRKNNLMKAQVKNLTDDQIEKIATYLSSVDNCVKAPVAQ